MIGFPHFEVIANTVIRASGTKYVHADGLGSIRKLTDESGAVTDSYTYNAFGELLEHVGSDPQPYMFAGEAWEGGTALYGNRERWMDPRTGRFVSMDPVVENHAYAYANASPTVQIDPSGMDAFGLATYAVADLGFTSSPMDMTPWSGRRLRLVRPDQVLRTIIFYNTWLDTTDGRHIEIREGRMRDSYVQKLLAAVLPYMKGPKSLGTASADAVTFAPMDQPVPPIVRSYERVVFMGHGSGVHMWFGKDKAVKFGPEELMGRIAEVSNPTSLLHVMLLGCNTADPSLSGPFGASVIANNLKVGVTAVTGSGVDDFTIVGGAFVSYTYTASLDLIYPH